MKVSTRPRNFRAALSGDGQGTANSSSNNEVYARVAELAYRLYEQRGRQDGYDVEDWIQAEQTVLAAPDCGAPKTEGTLRRGATGKKAV